MYSQLTSSLSSPGPQFATPLQTNFAEMQRELARQRTPPAKGLGFPIALEVDFKAEQCSSSSLICNFQPGRQCRTDSSFSRSPETMHHANVRYTSEGGCV